jgi:hypothetical protein
MEDRATAEIASGSNAGFLGIALVYVNHRSTNFGKSLGKEF